jgi:hypothetical protein
MTPVISPRTHFTEVAFTADESYDAGEQWGFNCGPAALCAVLGKTPDEIRPHLLDFEQKRYTNPTLLVAILNGLKIPFRQIYRADHPVKPGFSPLPKFGLVRIQWAGPWTKPGVPMRVRYRKTHWIACCSTPTGRDIFDVNAMNDGGWLPYDIWATRLVPWLIRVCVPKGDGNWWPTHSLELSP